MNKDVYNEHFLNMIINPQLRVNGQYITEDTCNRTEPEELYASFLGEKCENDSIGKVQIIRFKVGSI